MRNNDDSMNARLSISVSNTPVLENNTQTVQYRDKTSRTVNDFDFNTYNKVSQSSFSSSYCDNNNYILPQIIFLILRGANRFFRTMCVHVLGGTFKSRRKR